MAVGMMSSQPLNFLIILHLFVIFYPSIGSSYVFDLIHRDSPLSPFYNPSITQFDRLEESFRRSFSRVDNLKKSAIIAQAPMNPGGGEYLMKMLLGTPPIEVVGIIDTGSDLTWTQCLPCIQCYNQTIPLFDPTHSSSYNNLTRATNFCQELPQDLSIENKTLACGYKFGYGDGTRTSGILASETLTLGTFSLPNFTFGCAHITGGSTFDASGSGIIGLSSNDLSLVSQLGPSIGKKFSYCLVPNSINTTSKISFGNDSVVMGSGTVTTPIQNSSTSLYHLTLEAISVGTERIDFPQSPNNQGNIVIDSGTTLTLLPNSVFKKVVSALDKLLTLEKVTDPTGVHSICYKTSSNICQKNEMMQLPSITMHFMGADVVLKDLNVFSWVRNDTLCFTMRANYEFVIYGNLAQTNFQIGFDLDAHTVSFKPTDCAMEHLDPALQQNKRNGGLPTSFIRNGGALPTRFKRNGALQQLILGGSVVATINLL